MGVIVPWPVLALDLGFLNWTHLITSGVLLADFLLRLLTAARVISRRLPSGATLSWLGFILFVPFFGAIPVLGILFQRRRASDTRNERVIFLTPRIVNRAEALGR